MVYYRKLWKMLEDKGLSQKILTDNGITSRVMDSLRHNGNLEVMTLVKICDILDCQFGDIIYHCFKVHNCILNGTLYIFML